MNDIKIKKLSRTLNMKVVERFWVDYSFGNGYGSRWGHKFAKNFNNGSINNISENDIRLGTILGYILDKRWDECVTFWVGYLTFCLKQRPELITYIDDPNISYRTTLSKCCKNLEFPEWCRAKVEKIFETDFSFEDYIVAASKLKKTCFNVESALSVYKLQGDEACLGILGQMFWTGSRGRDFDLILIPGIDIKYIPEVSDFVSGVSFPCWVMPFTKNLHWEERINGWFLMSGNTVVDVAQVGHFNVFNNSLGNRISFFSQGGLNRGVICYSWGDIVKAVGQYGGDVLVRSLNENLFVNDWHRFGLGGLIAVYLRGNSVYSKNPKEWKRLSNCSCNHATESGFTPVVINLAGQYVKDCGEEKVVYSHTEMEDWFELAELCKKEKN